MKRVLLSLAVLSVSFSLQAQTKMPSFAKLGYNKQLLYTSSKGEFEEFHDLTDVVEIGSALFNTKTNQMVGFVSEEKTDAEVSSATTAMSIDPLCEKYYWISPYAFALNNPVRYTDPTGKYIVGMDGKPVTYDDKNGWSSNASEDVQRIGNAMMITPEGKDVFNNMVSTDYGITINYKEGFHPENENKSGDTEIKYDGNGKITSVALNLYDGKIKEDVAAYQKASQPGNTIINPTEKQQILSEQVPSMTERIGQVGAHEGTHATNPLAMPFRVGGGPAEIPAVAVEMKAIRQTTEFNRPIQTNLKSVRVKIR